MTGSPFARILAASVLVALALGAGTLGSPSRAVADEPHVNLAIDNPSPYEVRVVINTEFTKNYLSKTLAPHSERHFFYVSGPVELVGTFKMPPNGATLQLRPRKVTLRADSTLQVVIGRDAGGEWTYVNKY